MRTIHIIAILLAVLLVACVPVPTEQNTTTSGATDEPQVDLPETPSAPVTIPTTPAKPTETPERPALYTVAGVEGDLIELKPRAIDPDGDNVRYSFTKPFDKDGRWQTKIGDEGKYDVTVGADDGKSTTTETVRVMVGRANRAPIIDCTPVIMNEGEQVNLHKACTVSDEDDSEVIVTYSGWMTGWRYTTTYEDAGTHTVTLTASDKNKGQFLHTVTKDVLVTIKNVNRAPAFDDSFPTLITGTENDVITLPRPLIADPDKDQVAVTYSAPFDKTGVWKTKIGDAGAYDVDVVASDGTTTTKKTVTVKIGMLNTAPVLKRITDIAVKEGDTVKLSIDAYDREGDKLTVTISGWMTRDTYTTTYDDAGSYTVKVSVTDGVFTTDQVIHVTVADQNRPPVFVTPA